jgi:hypothetical protein
MVTAREKFRIGQKVRLTALAFEQKIRVGRAKQPIREGELVGFAKKDPEVVRVLPDGLKTSSKYHMDFWEPVPGESARREPETVAG